MPSKIVRRAHVPDEHLTCVEHPVLRQIYASRGIETAEQLNKGAAALLHFSRLNGIQQAVSLLVEAIKSQQKIVIIGDFDADGATSTALCMLALSQLGSRDHHYLVPNRFDFGYGLSPEIVDMAHQQGAQLIITVDNGISCHAGVERAKALGVTVVITDHHLPGESLPQADAIVNPNLQACEFPSKNLAGVGVAFYLMLALRSALREQDWFTAQGIAEPNLAALLDLVALGTVADVVSLDDNNRVLVHQGIQRIKAGKCRPGITAMLEIAGKQVTRLVSSDLGFVLGPRLNAAGRLDDMSLGIECLITQDAIVAKQIAAQLDNLNRERREIESSMQIQAEQALASFELNSEQLPNSIVLYKDDFHQGVIGILAGRIKDKYFRPTIAFAHQDDHILKGSARSIPGVHIRDLLEEVNSRYPGVIIKFGGHAMAAGLSLEVDQLDAFKAVFESTADEFLDGKSLDGEILSDGALPEHDFSLQFAQQLKEAGPWGQNFVEPVFDGEFELVNQRIVGQKHLKLVVKHPSGALLDGIAFNVDTNVWPDDNITNVQLAYRLDINEFRGNISLQLMVESIQAC